MPRSHPPTQKRPAVVHTDSDARIVPTSRSLEYIDPETSGATVLGNLIHVFVWEKMGVSDAY